MDVEFVKLVCVQNLARLTTIGPRCLHKLINNNKNDNGTNYFFLCERTEQQRTTGHRVWETLTGHLHGLVSEFTLE